MDLFVLLDYLDAWRRARKNEYARGRLSSVDFLPAPSKSLVADDQIKKVMNDALSQFPMHDLTPIKWNQLRSKLVFAGTSESGEAVIGKWVDLDAFGTMADINLLLNEAGAHRLLAEHEIGISPHLLFSSANLQVTRKVQGSSLDTLLLDDSSVVLLNAVGSYIDALGELALLTRGPKTSAVEFTTSMTTKLRYFGQLHGNALELGIATSVQTPRDFRPRLSTWIWEAAAGFRANDAAQCTSFVLWDHTEANLIKEIETGVIQNVDLEDSGRDYPVLDMAFLVSRLMLYPEWRNHYSLLERHVSSAMSQLEGGTWVSKVIFQRTLSAFLALSVVNNWEWPQPVRCESTSRSRTARAHWIRGTWDFIYDLSREAEDA